MITAESFARAAQRRGYLLWSGVPCSYLKPFINFVIDAGDLRYVAAANEGEAVAVAAGAELGGIRGIVMFQNSGLGNAVNPLSSLTYIFRIPILIIVTLRGEPGGPPDEPQHELMGRITIPLLELLGIAWEYFPSEERDIEPALQRADLHMKQTGTSYALVMRKGSVAERELASRPVAKPWGAYAAAAAARESPVATRRDVLRAVQRAADPSDILVASTGYTGRELYALEDRSNQLYLVGSMGCASSLGLGLALALPRRRIIVLDGDGAVLMRMGALATIGYERPGNLVHVVLDNQRHESTGGQATVSHSLDFCAVAAACGYPRVRFLVDPQELEANLGKKDESLSFWQVKIRPGVPEGLPRPKIQPRRVAARLRAFIKETERKEGFSV